MSNASKKINLEQILISPLTGLELKNNSVSYCTNNEEYPVVNNIPVLITKNDINKYLESEYKLDFKYYKFWDASFIKNLKKKLKIKSGSLLLDIGGGEGFYSKSFNDLGVNTITADFSKYLLEKGKQNYPMLTFIAADANKIPFSNNTFDTIFCSGLSSFNTNDLSKCSILIDHMIDKLKPGGLFIFIHSTNLTGKLSHTWYNISYSDLNHLFRKHKVMHKWFIPRPLVTNILNQISFSFLSSKFFGFIIKNLSFIHHKINGRLIYIIKKDS